MTQIHPLPSHRDSADLSSPPPPANRSYKALIVLSLFLSIVALLFLLRSIELFGRSVESVATQLTLLKEEQRAHQASLAARIARLDAELELQRSRVSGKQRFPVGRMNGEALEQLRESLAILEWLEEEEHLSEKAAVARSALETLIEAMQQEASPQEAQGGKGSSADRNDPAGGADLPAHPLQEH
ncbi:MAG: hypothetical protein D6812_14775 [Deltaproteobacteria bacterium]|nr:MAG: hypothetical protein D6812_14775 [Deltaproteobacteria bacterium]